MDCYGCTHLDTRKVTCRKRNLTFWEKVYSKVHKQSVKIYKAFPEECEFFSARPKITYRVLDEDDGYCD